ncbi:MAG TPA: hypothetical protein VLA99_06050 [Nitrospiraceae bacterium]|nr:hypothetical protein [Nitrospiraceae bacterium]
MAKRIDIVIVQYPSGTTTLIWFDPATGSIATTHAGLQARLRRGVRDWEGRVVVPEDGRAFLSAVYDDLFLNGHHVRWVKVVSLRKVRAIYPV